MASEPRKTDGDFLDGSKEVDLSSRPSTVPEEAVEKEQQLERPLSPEGPQEGDPLNDYLTGLKLFLLLFSTGLVFFVLLLDNSIISTVSDISLG